MTLIADQSTCDDRLDQELVAATRGGDRDAYAALYSRYRDRARKMAAKIRPNPADVDDLVAEAFLRVFNALTVRHVEVESFGGYLAITLRNLAFQQHHAAKRVAELADRAPEEEGEPFRDPALAAFEQRTLTAAFAGLPGRWQEVLWLTLVQGMRPAAIANRFDMSANAVAALALRAREGLRERYLRAHLPAQPDRACCDNIELLSALIKGRASKCDSAQIAEHLRTCQFCSALVR